MSIGDMGPCPPCPRRSCRRGWPCALAISAAVIGAIWPWLFTPSVSRMMTFDLASLSRRRLIAVANSVADGRAVLDQSAADAGQKGLQRALVGGQRALREGFAGEGHQSDAVAVAVGDERSGHLLGGRDAVGPEVAGEHRGRDVVASTMSMPSVFVRTFCSMSAAAPAPRRAARRPPHAARRAGGAGSGARSSVRAERLPRSKSGSRRRPASCARRSRRSSARAA